MKKNKKESNNKQVKATMSTRKSKKWWETLIDFLYPAGGAH